jgi:hypothetical protein
MATAKLTRVRLKGEGQAVELEVDEVAGGVTSLAACGDVGAASLLDGNGDCRRMLVVIEQVDGRLIHTNGDAQAVGTDEVLTAVAAGELLAVTASSGVRLGVDVNVGVVIGSAAGGGSNDDSSHGGDDERLEEGHFVDWVD